jgi:2-phosphosulfolactate phosphatase
VNDAQPQQKYQVRFDWGLAGFQALTGQADVVILADALPAAGATAGAESGGAHGDALAYLTPLPAHRVIAAGLGNRMAVAEWVLARQAEKGDRFAVAVIAVGEGRPDGTFRPAVEDLLAAGAVIDALTGLGIDHCSPDAAAASAAFVGLKQALRHLVSASETGQALAAAGRQAEVVAAGKLDESRDVALLGEFAFPA